MRRYWRRMHLGPEVRSAGSGKKLGARDALFRGRGASGQSGALGNSALSDQPAVTPTTHSKRLSRCRDVLFATIVWMPGLFQRLKGYPQLGSSAASGARSRCSTRLGAGPWHEGDPNQAVNCASCVRPQDRSMAAAGQHCAVHPPPSRLPTL